MSASNGRLAIFLVAAAIVFLTALNNDVYAIASPAVLSMHVLLRKVESIVAFTVVAFLGARWLGPRRRLAAILIIGTAIYSALIEVAQYSLGSKEGLGWEVFDTACGAIGGAFALVVFRFLRTNAIKRL